MKKPIAIFVAAAILIVAAIVFLLNSTDDVNRLDEAEAMERVTDLYGGEAERAEISGNLILVEFKNKEGRYTASVDSGTGKVNAIKLLEKSVPAKKINDQEAEKIALAEVEGELENTAYSAEQNEYEIRIKGATQISIIAISAETGEVRKIATEEIIVSGEPSEEEPAPEPARVITRDEAIAIALQTLVGEVQEVEFVDTVDGGYYLVEIENDETDQEATIQIHAIRGDTMTVDWDD